MASGRFAQGFGAALLALVLACSGASGNKFSAAQDVVVVISPDSETLYPSDRETFTASVTGTADPSVTWAVSEGDAGGTVAEDGTYTAPSTEGAYHLVATSKVSLTSKATSSVSVSSQARRRVTVTVAPTTATVAVGGSQAFTCAVTGSADTACTWSVREGASGGSVTSAGVYTAPQTAGTYHVVARSHADSNRSATATVTVTASQTTPVAISITPATASVDACGTLTFAATVTGTSNTAASWSVSEGSAGGSVGTGGVYTAPASAGTYHVVATSQADPSRSQTATVTVTEKILSVEVSPGSTTATTGGTVQFTATVTTTCGSFTQTAEAGGS